jgi:hypothetical protein
MVQSPASLETLQESVGNQPVLRLMHLENQAMPQQDPAVIQRLSGRRQPIH